MSLPITTIPPFQNTAQLPACAINCGPLHDANGACVPPAAPQADAATYNQCFCANAKVAPFATGTSGVCDAACPAEGLVSIANWFQELCGNQAGNPAQPTATLGAGSGSSGSRNSTGGGGGDWLSNHWKWVIMLVVLVVGIAGIWIGACIWRRRYLKKKDRQSTIPQKHSGSVSHPSWGPGLPTSEPNKAVFEPPSTAVTQPEKVKKKWIVKNRT